MTDADRMNALIGAHGGHAGGALDGIDTFEGPQEPHLPKTDDPLARFAIARVLELEREPRGEVAAVYDAVGGPMAHRYAKHVREDCIVFRKVIALYLSELAAADAAVEDNPASGPFYVRAGALHAAVEAIAQRWASHADFDESWA